jgi:transcriptional regulator
MAKGDQDSSIELLQGTLDMLILQTLVFGPRHGHAIAHTIERTSRDVLRIDHGSLYPALQRLERRGLITAAWGTSENNRRAKFYRLTPAGRKRLVAPASKWERLTDAIARIMRPGGEEV